MGLLADEQYRGTSLDTREAIREEFMRVYARERLDSITVHIHAKRASLMGRLFS